MQENVRLPLLERLIGREVSAVCFVRDYVQVMFDGMVLTCYAMPRLRISGESLGPEMPGYRDKLCQLIGKPVQFVANEPEELSIRFDEGGGLTVSLRPEDATSVEAAMLHEEGREELVVWHYGD